MWLGLSWDWPLSREEKVKASFMIFFYDSYRLKISNSKGQLLFKNEILEYKWGGGGGRI